MKHVLVVANGELSAGTAARLRNARFDEVIAVDGGAGHCLAMGLAPGLVVGDLDSAAPETLQRLAAGGTRIERHPVHKDETDLELALLGAAGRGAGTIVLAAALGGRLDMALANLLLLAHPDLEGVRIEVWEDRQTSRLLRPPGAELRGSPGDTLSLMPLLGDAEGLVTEGLAYPLKDEILRFGRTRGLSNVFTGDRARVGLRTGLLLAIHAPA